MVVSEKSWISYYVKLFITLLLYNRPNNKEKMPDIPIPKVGVYVPVSIYVLIDSSILIKE